MRKIEYALVNGIALLTYVEGRNTQDIDLITALPSLVKLLEIKIESQDVLGSMYNAIHSLSQAGK